MKKGLFGKESRQIGGKGQMLFSLDQWNLHAGEVKAESLVGQGCYGAFDVSDALDFAAVALCFPPAGVRSTYRFLIRPIVSASFLHGHRRSAWGRWVEEWWARGSMESRLSLEFVTEWLKVYVRKYLVRELATDRYSLFFPALWSLKELTYGVGLSRSRSWWDPACRLFLEKLGGGEIEHDGNPAMAWMIGAVGVEMDGEGHMYPSVPDSRKSKFRTEGVTAAITAFCRAVEAANQPFIASRMSG